MIDEPFESTGDCVSMHGIRTLDVLDPMDTMSVYCRCGSIVPLDRVKIQLKLTLRKELQCPSCRFKRISREMDELDKIFYGEPESECF